MLEVGRRFGVYGTAAIVKFCNPLPPMILANPPCGTLELKVHSLISCNQETKIFVIDTFQIISYRVRIYSILGH